MTKNRPQYEGPPVTPPPKQEPQLTMIYEPNVDRTSSSSAENRNVSAPGPIISHLPSSSVLTALFSYPFSPTFTVQVEICPKSLP